MIRIVCYQLAIYLTFFGLVAHSDAKDSKSGKMRKSAETIVNSDSKDPAIKEAREKVMAVAKEGVLTREEMVRLAKILGADLTKGGKTVDDALAQKLLVKFVKESRSMEEKLSQYEPGELERLQKEQLKFLKEPAPFEETTFHREHRLSFERLDYASRELDKIIQAKLSESGQSFNPLSTDEQFVRRIYLDAAGRIPTPDETQAFLSDRRPNKRRELIDRLLLSENYPSQMFNWVADMLRVRDLKSNQGDNEGYQAWLMDQFAANRPWNETVRDLLTAEGDLVTAPQVGWLDRDGGVLTNSLSNTLTTFMGANVACAECHNHPSESWTQREFYELTSFFGSMEIPGKNVRGAPKIRKNHLHVAYHDPEAHLSFPEDYKYDDAEPGSRVTPKFPVDPELAPRTEGTKSEPLGPKDFAGWMTNPKNIQFAATIANRLWGKAFGRAVMEPVTEMDDLTKADNPRLIQVLAGLMQWSDAPFDLMSFQRIIYNTRAYQSQSNPTPEGGEPYWFSGPLLRRMSAEQAWDSLATLAKGEAVNAIRRERKLHTWSQDVFAEGAFGALHSQFDKDATAEVKTGLEYDLLISEASKLQSRLLTEHLGRKGGKGKGGEDPGIARASELRQPEEPFHFLRQFGQSERELADFSTREGGIPQVLMLMNGSDHKMLADPQSYLMSQVENAGSPGKKSGPDVSKLFQPLAHQRRKRCDRRRRLHARRSGLAAHEHARIHLRAMTLNCFHLTQSTESSHALYLPRQFPRPAPLPPTLRRLGLWPLHPCVSVHGESCHGGLGSRAARARIRKSQTRHLAESRRRVDAHRHFRSQRENQGTRDRNHRQQR